MQRSPFSIWISTPSNEHIWGGVQSRGAEIYLGLSRTLLWLLQYYLKAEYRIIALSNVLAGQVPNSQISKRQKGFEPFA